MTQTRCFRQTGQVGASNHSFSGAFFGSLDAGQKIGLAIDYAGLYYNDSTGVRFTLNGPGGVPEPATWALMIVGFGGAGAMLRRRRAALVAA